MMYLLRVLLFTLLLAPCWWLATPLYNLYLAHAAENLLHLAERPDVSRISLSAAHDAHLLRLDLSPARQLVSSFRVTDIHFTALLSAAVILAQRLPARARMSQLLYAALLCVPFHLTLILAIVHSSYALELPESTAHYGPLARNGLALLRHLLDLPFKFALPLLVWGLFCYPVAKPTLAQGGPNHGRLRRYHCQRLDR